MGILLKHQNITNDKPIISIAVITYNHGKYIAENIESVLSQKCNYKIEMIISDDCSNDDTQGIIRKYATKYSNIIKPIYNIINIGMQANAAQCLMACTGKYIAILEGDDYWIDPYKLQRQVDFLEKNPDYSACFTAIDVLNELGDAFYLPTPFLNFTEDSYMIEDIILPPPDKPLSIPMMTLVMRNCIGPKLPDFFMKTLQADTAITLILGTKGKFRFFQEKTAVYRQHTGGITKSKEFQLKFDRSMFDLIDNFNEYSHHKYNDVIKQRLYPMAQTLLMYGSSLLKGKEKREHISRMLKGYKKYRPFADIKEIIYYRIVLFFPIAIKIHKLIFKK